MHVDRPAPPPPPKPKPRPAEPKPEAKPRREGRSSQFEVKKGPTRRESRSTSFVATRIAKTPTAALDNVKSAKSAYDHAKKQADALNQRLMQQMQKVGPALTAKEKEQYAKSFHQKYAKDFDSELHASKRLGQALLDPMLDKAVEKDPKAAGEAIDAAKSLAQSSHAADALRFVAHAFDKANPASAAYRAQKRDIEKDVVAPAAENAPGQLMIEQGNAQAALQSYKQLLNNVSAVGFGGKDIKSGMQLLDHVQGAIAKGGVASLTAKDFLKTANAGPLAKAMSSASLAFAGLSIEGDIEQKNYLKLTADVTSTAQTGIGVANGALKALNSAGKLAGLETAAKSIRFLSRLGPGIGIISNAIAVGVDAQGLAKSPSVAGAVTTVGDSIALAGSAVGVVLPGVGQIIEGAGLVISAVGSLIGGQEAKHKLDDEEQQLLGESGLDGKVAHTLAQSDDGVIGLLGRAGAHLPPEAIQALAAHAPETFGAPGYAQAVVDAAKAEGLHGKDVPGFVQAMKKDDPSYLSTLFAQLEGRDTRLPAVHDETLRQVIAARMPDAGAYAKHHAPGTFGAAAEQRQQADRDLEYATSMGDWAQVTNLLKKSGSKPGYQAEIIRQLKAQNTLGIWARQVGTTYHFNGWPEAAAQAVRAAEREGVLSPAEAKQALSTIG